MDIIDYYNNYDEKTRMFRTKARSIEYLTTIHVLKNYYSKNSSILELGAAYGPYTKFFIGNGVRILATDIIPKYVNSLIDEFSCFQNFRSMILDAKDLSPLGNEQFDLILCMGPYYHTQEKGKRAQILLNCKDHLSDGGILAIAYINKNFAFPLYYKMNKPMGKKEIDEFDKSNFQNLALFDQFMGFSYFTTPEEIEEEVSKAKFQILENVGTDSIYAFMSESIEKLNDEQFNDFIEHHYKTCTCKNIIGVSNHGLLLCRN